MRLTLLLVGAFLATAITHRGAAETDKQLSAEAPVRPSATAALAQQIQSKLVAKQASAGLAQTETKIVAQQSQSPTRPTPEPTARPTDERECPTETEPPKPTEAPLSIDNIPNLKLSQDDEVQYRRNIDENDGWGDQEKPENEIKFIPWDERAKGEEADLRAGRFPDWWKEAERLKEWTDPDPPRETTTPSPTPRERDVPRFLEEQEHVDLRDTTRLTTEQIRQNHAELKEREARVEKWDAGLDNCVHSSCNGKARGNTHVYIVQQAVELIGDTFNQLKTLMNKPECKPLWENGVWDMDSSGLADSDKKGSHFWNPGKKDWNGDPTDTNTWKDLFMNHDTWGNAKLMADGYMRTPLYSHMYTFGRALHFVGDVTMPMHSASMSAMNSWLMLHPYYEMWVASFQGGATANGIRAQWPGETVKWPWINERDWFVDVWVGHAPACGASASSCSELGMTYVSGSTSKCGDPNWGVCCNTGNKVKCRYTFPARHASFTGTNDPWDLQTPNAMFSKIAKRSNNAARTLVYLLKANTWGCTYTEGPINYNGYCFKDSFGVKEFTKALLKDAFVSMANYIYVSYYNFKRDVPNIHTQWMGTAPACAASNADCREWGGIRIKNGDCGDGSCCSSGHKVQCQKNSGMFQDQFWMGTAISCAAGKSDCTENNAIYLKDGNCGDGDCCWTGHKVQCRYRWKASDYGFAWPAPVYDVRYEYKWFGTAVFCAASADDCTNWGGWQIETDDCGDGDCCWSGHKVRCKRKVYVAT